MSTKTLKSTFRRSGLFVAAFALLAATIAPAASTFADALNPLTDRSLTLSSSSPGWSYLDASGNDTYAQPNSGANGRQTGNTFSFNVSSTSTLEAFTFQYCTTPAGNCRAPGDIPYDTSGGAGNYTRTTNDLAIPTGKSDLEIVSSGSSEVSAVTFGANFSATSGQPTSEANVPSADNLEGNFIVLHKAPASGTWLHSAGWSLTADNVESGLTSGTVEDGEGTGKNNYMSLTNASGQALAAGDNVKIIFFGTDTNYITNPGSGAFFVKINTYNSDTLQDDTTLVDGGVTVANVMNRSIEIQTKVLETMQFSVGTVDPNTLDSSTSQYEDATGSPTHGTCDAIAQGMDAGQLGGAETPNVLQLGDADGEFSLSTDRTYSTHSYWRLSSNSSAGASVYYSGVTLSNTVGDQIEAIGTTAEAPTRGSEQFGLALDNGVGPNYEVSYAKEREATFAMLQNGADNDVAGLHTASLTTDGAIGNGSWHNPRLFPMAPVAQYGDGTGRVNANYGALNPGTVDTSFAFDPESTLIPVPFASGTDVVDCVTGKMRYIANIAATTPAGIYTTKINYIAAPKY